MAAKKAAPILGKALFFLACAGVAAIFVWFGKTGWPGLHWDAALFGTPVINMARNKGWLWAPGLGDAWRPLSLIRDSFVYNIHGLLHVILYGGFFKTKTWSDYTAAMGIVNALTFASYTALYAVLLAKRGRAGFKSYGSALLLGLIPAVISLGLQGRPEQIIPLLLILPLLASLSGAKRSISILVSALTLSLVAIASPLPGAMFFLAMITYYGLLTNRNWRERCCDIAAFSALTVSIGWLIITLLTPFTPIDWVTTVLGRGSETLNLNGLLHGPADWGGWTLVAPGWSLLTIFFILSGLAAVWKRRGRVGLIAIAALVTAWIVLNQKTADYSYAPFIPYALALGLIAPHDLLLPKLKGDGTGTLFQRLMVALGCVYLLVLGWYALASWLLPYQELSLKQAETIFLQSAAGKESNNPEIAIGYPWLRWPSMVALGNPDASYISLDIATQPEDRDEVSRYESKTGRQIKYLVFPQTKAARNPCPPPQNLFVGRSEFSLLENHWHCPQPTLFDRIAGPTPLANRYNLAIYKRLSPPLAPP